MQNTNRNASKKRQRGNPKKSNRRRSSWEDRESRDMKRDDQKETTNNPKWYAQDPALLRDSASIPFSWPLGSEWIASGRDYPLSETINEPLYSSVPGLMVMKLLPTFGAGLESDALNIAAASTYTFVRHTNAGHANYDPNDLMLYIIAMTNVYSFVNYAERLYAIATLYEQRNRYLPDTLFQAMDVDPNSIKNNLADYRFALNVLINKISSIAVPASMDIFLRHAMLYSYVYSEGPSVKDQLYMYAPVGFLKFQLDEDGAGCLKLSSIPRSGSGGTHLWTDIISYGNALFNAIWEQEDFGIMSGDILKSYGNNILSIKSLDEVIPFSTVYDPMVLHQMKNATPYMEYDGSTFGIFQDSAKAKLNVTLNANSIASSSLQPWWYNATGERTLTLDSDSPTPEMVIEATRLISGIKSVSTASGQTEVLIYTGSEMVVDTIFYGKNGQLGVGGNIDWTVSIHDNMYTQDSNQSSISRTAYLDLMNFAIMLKAFKYAPAVRLISAVDSTSAAQRLYTIQEVDNFAVLSDSDIQKMHTAAILNLLHVPSVAKNVTV